MNESEAIDYLKKIAQQSAIGRAYKDAQKPANTWAQRAAVEYPESLGLNPENPPKTKTVDESESQYSLDLS